MIHNVPNRASPKSRSLVLTVILSIGRHFGIDSQRSLILVRFYLTLIKCNYLIGCLDGAAADVIRRIPVSADNYDLAWTTLSNRFNRPRLVASSLLDKILRAPVANQESLLELNNFLSSFSDSLTLLNALKVPDMGSFFLFTIAFRCLPVATRKLFESTVTVDYPSFDDLLNFVHSRVSLLEIVGDPRKLVGETSSNAAVQIGQKKPSGFNRYRSRDSNRPTAVTSINAETVCLCCKDAHAIISCSKFKGWSLEARCEWARKQRLRFRCLGDDHWAPKCRSSIV